MDSRLPDSDDSPDLERDMSDDRTQPGEKSWFSEIADQLESNPQECWEAFESLQTVEPELRLSIIDELAGLGSRPGAEMLLRLLSSARDPATRAAARSALERMDGEARDPVQVDGAHQIWRWTARLMATLGTATASDRCYCRPTPGGRFPG